MQKLPLPKGVVAVSVYLTFCLTAALFFIVVIHLNWMPVMSADANLRSHSLCAAFGMLGASMASIRKLYRSGITLHVAAAREEKCDAANPFQSWCFAWLCYFLSRPLFGGVLGALTFLLSNVGLQVMAKPVNGMISAEGRYILFGVACLSGYSVSHVLDRISHMSKKVFKLHPSGLD